MASNRISTVTINLPEQYFKLTSLRNNAITHVVSKDSTGFMEWRNHLLKKKLRNTMTETRAKFMKTTTPTCITHETERCRYNY
jgi:hypothetical protein